MTEKLDKPFYITTTLPYVNAKPHIGFAMEIIRADVIARYKHLTGHDVFFNTGTDEHGTKIHQKAQEEGKDTQEFVDEHAAYYKKVFETLNISYTNFIRTTDEYHIKAAQEFWKQCDANGYIYKKTYSGTYCVGCEMFVTEKDLVNGECPHHLGKKLEEVSEENYFFKYSAFAEKLLELYKTPNFVVPDFRLKEITNFVQDGLEDFSISRLKSKMPWGVEVPGDSEHVMYVWFDALVDYISTLGWPNDMEKFNRYWVEGTPVQYCGKDNIQHQAARWQAMLLSVGLPNTRQIIVNGFINSNGQKMSKSIGNVVNPLDLVEVYGTDALRYYVTREFNPFEDSDFTREKFYEGYTANLVNGIGNLTSRIMKMAETHLEETPELNEVKVPQAYTDAFGEFNLQKASDICFEKIGELDGYIQETEPFKLVKTDLDAAKDIIKKLVIDLHTVAHLLSPFMPDTSEKIVAAITANKKPEESLFERKELRG